MCDTSLKKVARDFANKNGSLRWEWPSVLRPPKTFQSRRAPATNSRRAVRRSSLCCGSPVLQLGCLLRSLRILCAFSAAYSLPNCRKHVILPVEIADEMSAFAARFRIEQAAGGRHSSQSTIRHGAGHEDSGSDTASDEQDDHPGDRRRKSSASATGKCALGGHGVFIFRYP